MAIGLECYKILTGIAESVQHTKPPAPTTGPLTNIPIGRPWEMVAVDILEVPVSQNSNHIYIIMMIYMLFSDIEFTTVTKRTRQKCIGKYDYFH